MTGYSSVRSSIRRIRARRTMSDINVVPYIDVMLVLLVIFMITAPIVSPSIINLPTVGNTIPQQQQILPAVIVNIRADGNIYVRYKSDAGGTMQQKNITRSDLHNFIVTHGQSHPDQPVVIAADKTVKYEAVINVMSELKVHGVKRIGLLVKTP